jgi:hypothetical protein
VAMMNNISYDIIFSFWTLPNKATEKKIDIKLLEFLRENIHYEVDRRVNFRLGMEIDNGPEV